MYYLGIDIGAAASKACIINENKEVIAFEIVNAAIGMTGLDRAERNALEHSGIDENSIKRSVVTGYGRLNYVGANEHMSEISCHAKAVYHLLPETRTIIDIGGQDAKAIKIDKDGFVQRFVMNDKCAAGTGRFIEVMARVMELELHDFDALAMKAKQPATISSICTVFAESEVISQLASNIKKEDVIAGIINSIASRTSNLARRIGIEPLVVFTGGVALNRSIRIALERILEVQIEVPSNPQITGALGAALFAHLHDKEGKGK